MIDRYKAAKNQYSDYFYQNAPQMMSELEHLYDSILKKDNKLKKENDGLNAKTIATGGLSKLFAKDLNCINYFENDLTLNGLIIISKKIYE